MLPTSSLLPLMPPLSPPPPMPLLRPTWTHLRSTTRMTRWSTQASAASPPPTLAGSLLPSRPVPLPSPPQGTGTGTTTTGTITSSNASGSGVVAHAHNPFAQQQPHVYTHAPAMAQRSYSMGILPPFHNPFAAAHAYQHPSSATSPFSSSSTATPAAAAPGIGSGMPLSASGYAAAPGAHFGGDGVGGLAGGLAAAFRRSSAGGYEGLHSAQWATFSNSTNYSSNINRGEGAGAGHASASASTIAHGMHPPPPPTVAAAPGCQPPTASADFVSAAWTAGAAPGSALSSVAAPSLSASSGAAAAAAAAANAARSLSDSQTAMALQAHVAALRASAMSNAISHSAFTAAIGTAAGTSSTMQLMGPDAGAGAGLQPRSASTGSGPMPVPVPIGSAGAGAPTFLDGWHVPLHAHVQATTGAAIPSPASEGGLGSGPPGGVGVQTVRLTRTASAASLQGATAGANLAGSYLGGQLAEAGSAPSTGSGRGSVDANVSVPDLVTDIPLSDKRYRNRKLLRDLRQYLYRWLNTSEFRQITKTYSQAEWVSNPDSTSSKDRFFHVNFQARDYYKTNHELIDEIVRIGLALAEEHPQEYGCAPGVLKASHIEDVAKDLMDSARSGFRQSLRTDPGAKDCEKQKDQKDRETERSKIVSLPDHFLCAIMAACMCVCLRVFLRLHLQKQRGRELGAAKLKHPIPRPLLMSGAFSDDAASDEDLHGMDIQTWKAQRSLKLKDDHGLEALTPRWRNPHLTRAYQLADKKSKNKHLTRWRRDQPVELDVPHSLRGRRLPSALFDKAWLAENKHTLNGAPYYITIDEEPVAGWSDQLYPLDEGNDGDDEDDASDDDRRSNKRKRTSTLMNGGSTQAIPHQAFPQFQLGPVDGAGFAPLPGVAYSVHPYQLVPPSAPAGSHFSFF
ncbi:hypothetical protein K437DRAFT_30369 [Tilletiaria anomala UBC 951]|uniref:Uncharacterized protein n=1 Tax=Tilletiaria anomala (strain ATCC 24038 / CBS 436.72 / UBC 951) TaxID=1037660 RepID=A0A066V8H9_TILAU|nr:uncharacterized protein K437DRAFT_30369 [Tilletiaria anomala UBC 951]KDN38047.1 hypothetical protein K437DRAFT_30369 [Tilletiaria anomala UBC 951]